MRDIFYWALILCLCPILSEGQIIQGRIFDATNNEGLPGAAIVNMPDSSVFTANARGLFEVEINSFPVDLTFSYLGYKSRTITIPDSEEFLNVGLNASDQHLNEVVISATRFNQKLLEVPAAVNVISSEQLQRNDETMIMPVINRMPGIMMESGSLNTNRLSIRGIGSRTPYGTNRVRVYFNEIPLTTGEGESTIEDIDLNALRRVEIIKGPASSIYGAGLGGTINLLSSSPEYLETEATARYTGGSFGLRNKQFSIAHGMDNANISININDLHSDGYRENSEYDRQSVTISSSVYSNDDNFSLSFLGSFIDLKAYIPSSIDKVTFQNSPESAAANWLESQGYEAYVKSFAGFSTRYRINNRLSNYSGVFISFRDADEPRPFDILMENTVAAGFRTRFEYDAGSSSHPLTIQAGVEGFGDWFKWSTYENLYQDFPGQGSFAGEILSNNKERRNYYNLFAQLRWEISRRLNIEGGVNYNVTNYNLTDLYYDDLDQSDEYAFDPVLSPRIGLSYKLREGWNLFGTISHGYSMPSLEETLTPEGLVNTDIKPETGTNHEIGTKGRWLNNQMYGELSIYHADINNLLVAERTGPDQYVGVNAGKTTHDGLEMILNYRWKPSGSWVVEPFVSFTATNYRFREYIHRETDFSGKRISGFPENILNVGVDIKNATGLYFFGDFRYVGEAALNDANTLFNAAYSLINVKAGYNFELGPWNLDINGGVNNLTDEHYASMVLVNAVAYGNNLPRYYYPGLPRNFYFGLKLRYEI
jgi:iron complex outermembrane receptor protein